MAMQGQFSILAHDPLWQALQGMQIEPPGAALSFAARLAREQGWSRRRAESVIEEYRRFLYLAATGDRPVTPSGDVDAAWHLHLTYTRHYWNELCGRILGKPLHHDPTEGGAAQQAHFHDQYAATLGRYEVVFGEPPRSDIWPSPAIRFGNAVASPPRRFPRLFAAGAVSLGASACSAAAADSGPTGTIFFVIMAVLLIAGVILVGSAFSGRTGKGKDGGSCGGGGGGYADGGSDSCGDGGSSGCGGGGCGGGGCGGGCGGS